METYNIRKQEASWQLWYRLLLVRRFLLVEISQIIGRYSSSLQIFKENRMGKEINLRETSGRPQVDPSLEIMLSVSYAAINAGGQRAEKNIHGWSGKRVRREARRHWEAVNKVSIRLKALPRPPHLGLMRLTDEPRQGHPHPTIWRDECHHNMPARTANPNQQWVTSGEFCF